MIKSVTPTTTPPVKTATPIDPTWLQTQFNKFTQFVSTHQAVGNDAGDRIAKLSSNLQSSLYAAFPDLKKATQTSAIDVNKVLTSRSEDIAKYLQTLSDKDQANVLTALDGQAHTLMATTQQTMAVAAPAPAVSTGPVIHPGAFAVTVNGNADSVTVAQLQDALQGFGDEILHQYEGRT